MTQSSRCLQETEIVSKCQIVSITSQQNNLESFKGEVPATDHELFRWEERRLIGEMFVTTDTNKFLFFFCKEFLLKFSSF